MDTGKYPIVSSQHGVRTIRHHWISCILPDHNASPIADSFQCRKSVAYLARQFYVYFEIFRYGLRGLRFLISGSCHAISVVFTRRKILNALWVFPARYNYFETVIIKVSFETTMKHKHSLPLKAWQAIEYYRNIRAEILRTAAQLLVLRVSWDEAWQWQLRYGGLRISGD